MTKTLRLSADMPRDLERAAAILRSGGTVAFPTETVYGLGATALDAAAVEAIFTAKQRPAWDPLIVHLAGAAQLAEITKVPPALEERVRQLAGAFWPGPLTLLLPRTSAIPDAVTATRPLVGVRVPAHPIARELLRLAALPVAAPSANTFGHTSPTTAAHVLADLDGCIDAVLDGGPSAVGVESTVLDPGSLTIYRPGAVTAEQIREVTGLRPTVYVAPAEPASHESLPSPGVGIRHYAPRARLVLLDAPAANVERLLAVGGFSTQEPRETTGVMQPNGWAIPIGTIAFPWGRWEDHEELAKNLFAGLRWLDDSGVSKILCPVPRGSGLAQAICDRLEKAAREE